MQSVQRKTDFRQNGLRNLIENLCLVCTQNFSVLKECNLGHHYEKLPADRYNSTEGQRSRDKVSEVSAVLTKQASDFVHSREISRAAGTASYDIAVASEPLSEGDFVKTRCRGCVALKKQRVLQKVNVTKAEWLI